MTSIRYAIHSSQHNAEDRGLWNRLAALQVTAVMARDPDAFPDHDPQHDIDMTSEALFDSLDFHNDNYTLVVAYACFADKTGKEQEVPAAYGVIAATPEDPEKPAILDQLYALPEIKMGKTRVNLKEFQLGRNTLDMLASAAKQTYGRDEIIAYPLDGSEGFYSRNGFRRGDSGNSMWSLQL